MSSLHALYSTKQQPIQQHNHNLSEPRSGTALLLLQVPAAATALIVGAFQTLSPMLAMLPTSLEHLQQKQIPIALAVVCHGALIGLALYPVGDVLLAKYLPLSFKAPLIAVTAASMVLNVLCTKVRVPTLRYGAVQPAWVP